MPDGSLYIQDAQEIFSGRSGVEFDGSSERQASRKFRVLTGTRLMGHVLACRCPGIPLRWSTYVSFLNGEYDTQLYLQKRSAEREHNDDWQSWIVTCDYDTKMPPGGKKKDGTHDNPEQDPPTVDWDVDVIHKALNKDLDGKAFLNSAKQPFKPAPTFEVARPVLIITKNELDFGSDAIYYYAYTTNRSTFLGAPPKSVRLDPPKAKLTFRGGIAYWKVTYRFVFGELNTEKDGNVEGDTPQLWTPTEILDEGLCELKERLLPIIGLKKMPYPIRREWGVISQPDLLDGAGLAVVPDAAGVRKPVYLKFKIYRQVEFDLLLRGTPYEPGPIIPPP